MSTSSAELERTTLERLREDFEAKGYRFVREPGRDQTPDFLGDYRPDALALGEHDNVIIEVKRSDAREAKIPLTQLAERVPHGKGWRYLLVYAGQDPSEISDLPRLDKSQIDGAVRETRKLVQLGYARAAFLEAWSILEALARRVYPEDIRLSLRPLSPLQVVERLAMEGEIDADAANRLRLLVPLRNSVAHGHLDARVSAADVDYLLALIEAINAHVS